MVQSIDPFSGASAALLRNLAQNQLDIGRTLERLSSGLRVNRAADDPFGITQITRAQGDLLSNRQAQLNNQQTSLMAATGADGARQVLSQLQRMREIVLASLNDSNTDLDRSQMQLEFSKLSEEIDRIARSTEYNGRKLLDGSTTASSIGRAASFEQSSDRQISDPVTGVKKNLFSTISLDGDAGADTRFQFRLFNEAGSNTTGLEISSSNGGILATYADFTAAPTSLSLSLNGSGGPYLRLDRTAFSSLTNTPLTSTELDTPLQTLVASGRIDAVTYGNLALTAGGQVFSSVIDVQGSTTLNQVLSAINGLSNASGTFAASYDAGTGKVSVGYTGTRQASATANTSYTPGIPGAAGGAFDAFALITAPPQGPAYRDPTSYLPAAGFAVASAQSYFPSLPGSVSAAFDLSGSNASLLSAFGIASSSNRGIVTGYNTSYYGETVATGGQSEYVNRTRLTIDDVTAEQTISGITTSLGPADLGETFRVLNTAVLNVPSFGAGDFSIDFGSNGVFTYAGFDPTSDTIQDVVGAINTYGNSVGNRVTAVLNSDDTLTINNTPAPATTDSKVDDPGLGAGGSFSIDFGSNGSFSYNLQPGTSTISDFVAALNAFKPGSVSAGFSDASDTLSLSNTVTPTYDTRVTDPGLSAGTFSIDFGSNGVYNFAFNPATQDLQDLIDGINGFKPGFVSASYDASSDRFSISNTANPVTEVKAYSPTALAGNFSINFGENGNFNFNFDPSTHSIQSVVNAINAFKPGFVSASYDATSDQLSISNISSTATSITASKVANPPLSAGTFSIDFGSNGIFNLVNPQNLTIQGFIDAINSYGAGQGGRVSASYNETSDQISISNTPLNVSIPDFDTKILDLGLGTGTFYIDFGSNGVLDLGLVNGANMTINTLVNAINNYTGEQAGGAVSASWDASGDRLVINNTVVDTVSSVTTPVGYKLTDPGVANSPLVIDFGDNGVFTSSMNLGQYTLNGILAEINSAGAGRYRILGDLNGDSFTFTNDTTDINSDPGTPGDYKVGTGGLGGFTDAAGQLTYKVQSSDGSIIEVWQSFGGNLLDATIDEIVDFFDYGIIFSPGLFNSAHASYDEFTDKLSINVYHQDISNPTIIIEGPDAAAFANFFKIGLSNSSPTASVSLESYQPIDNGGQGSPTDVSGADTSGLTLRQILTTGYGGTPPTPGTAYNNKIEFLSPGANAFFKVANAGNTNSNPDSSGDNANITFGSNIDNAGDPRLNLSDDDFYSVQISTLFSTPVTETITTTTPGNSNILFVDVGTGIQASLKLVNSPDIGTATQVVYGLDIDRGNLHSNLNISEPVDLGRTLISLATTPVATTSTLVPGNNQIVINDGGTGVSAFFRLSGASDDNSGNAQSVSSAGDIDRSSTSALLDVNGGDVSAKSLNQLATEQITYSGTPAGSNQISFGGSSNLQSFFRLSDRASTGTGGSNSVSSAGDIDKSSSTGYAQLDISDPSAATIGSLQTTGVYLSGGNNSISFGGSTGLQSLLKLSDVTSSGSGTRTAISSADIDRSSVSALLDIGGGDVNSISFQNLVSQPILTNGGDNNAITFSAGLGQQVRDFFKLTDRPDNSPVALGTASSTQTTASSAAIDNGGAGSPYDITAADVTGTSFQGLITTFASGTPNNQILIGGVNGANIRDLFNLLDVASDGTYGLKTSSSTSAIDNGSLDASLELDAGEISGNTIQELSTPRLGTLVSGALVIDGGTVLNIDPDTTTLGNLIDAINAYSGPSNKRYTASLNGGRLEIRVSDTETLSPATAPAAVPGEATPRVSGNALIFDSAAYVANDAPKSVGGVPLNPSGTGPGEQAFAATALDSRYTIGNPTAPADISSLSFGGASNLASVLHLGSVASSSPTASAAEYQGVISATGVNRYNLAATTRQSFTASSTAQSSQSIARTSAQIPGSETGVVTEIQVFGLDAPVLSDRALSFQYGRNEGDSESFGFSNLTAQNLGLEGLSLMGANSLQTRLRGNNALNVLDRAIEDTLNQISRLGLYAGSMERQAEAVASDSENLSRDLSDWQDADMAGEISSLTRQQLTAQAATVALAESLRNEERLFSLLFGSSLGSTAGSLLDGR